MSYENPLQKSKDQYKETIDRIKSDTAVGIDPQYTHAIIIEFLKQISKRLDVLEQKMSVEKR
jgi:hypothetical protein